MQGTFNTCPYLSESKASRLGYLRVVGKVSKAMSVSDTSSTEVLHNREDPGRGKGAGAVVSWRQKGATSMVIKVNLLHANLYNIHCTCLNARTKYIVCEQYLVYMYIYMYINRGMMLPVCNTWTFLIHKSWCSARRWANSGWWEHYWKRQWTEKALTCLDGVCWLFLSYS